MWLWTATIAMKKTYGQSWRRHYCNKDWDLIRPLKYTIMLRWTFYTYTLVSDNPILLVPSSERNKHVDKICCSHLFKFNPERIHWIHNILQTKPVQKIQELLPLSDHAPVEYDCRVPRMGEWRSGGRGTNQARNIPGCIGKYIYIYISTYNKYHIYIYVYIYITIYNISI